MHFPILHHLSIIDSYNKQPSNDENKKDVGSNDYIFVEKPSGSDTGSSVDPDSTNSTAKPLSNNAYLSLQPASGDPLDHTKEVSDDQHGPNPEASQSNENLTTKQKRTSITLHTKHLPSSTDSGQSSLQNEQNFEVKDKSKEKQNDSTEKTEGKVYKLNTPSSN